MSQGNLRSGVFLFFIFFTIAKDIPSYGINARKLLFIDLVNTISDIYILWNGLGIARADLNLTFVNFCS